MARNKDNDAMIMRELQRGEMQGLLQECDSAIMICVHPKDGLVYAFMNLSPIERRGMSGMVQDVAPHFYPDKGTDKD